ncbi:hypothetical protein, partial [Burkholderia pyrrocinia]|uniref:hypothetical protein n=1 Tax=Burkholderia pyrrocinia TaxID=60550 RepID=UPI001ABB9832
MRNSVLTEQLRHRRKHFICIATTSLDGCPDSITDRFLASRTAGVILFVECCIDGERDVLIKAHRLAHRRGDSVRGRDAAEHRFSRSHDATGASLQEAHLRATLLQFPHLRVQLGHTRSRLLERTCLFLGRHQPGTSKARIRGLGAIDLTLDFGFGADADRFPC